jgi:hypothetical protein
MAREADSCWRCGVLWATEVAPRPALRAIAGEPDADRWMNEGGSIASEAPAPLRAVAARA